MTFTIRDLQNYDEMLLVHHLQRAIWGLAEPDLGLYPPVLNTAAKNGGVVLGAFDEETGQMVGFLFSFLGREPGGPLKLCSQAMGVLPGWRGQGIAEGLKRVQRQRALAQRLPLITWTFDPLEAANAHLNLNKLGAVSRKYWRDVYGSHFGRLNAGLPTDRLLAEWWIQGEQVASRSSQKQSEAGAAVFEVEGQGPVPRIVRARLDLEAEALLLEIPDDIHEVKAMDLELALDWRLQVRQAFETYLARSYLVTGFVSLPEQARQRRCYVLQKSMPELLAWLGVTGS